MEQKLRDFNMAELCLFCKYCKLNTNRDFICNNQKADRYKQIVTRDSLKCELWRYIA